MLTCLLGEERKVLFSSCIGFVGGDPDAFLMSALVIPIGTTTLERRQSVFINLVVLINRRRVPGVRNKQPASMELATSGSGALYAAGRS